MSTKPVGRTCFRFAFSKNEWTSFLKPLLAATLAAPLGAPVLQKRCHEHTRELPWNQHNCNDFQNYRTHSGTYPDAVIFTNPEHVGQTNALFDWSGHAAILSHGLCSGGCGRFTKVLKRLFICQTYAEPSTNLIRKYWSSIFGTLVCQMCCAISSRTTWRPAQHLSPYSARNLKQL